MNRFQNLALSLTFAVLADLCNYLNGDDHQTHFDLDKTSRFREGNSKALLRCQLGSVLPSAPRRRPRLAPGACGAPGAPRQPARAARSKV